MAVELASEAAAPDRNVRGPGCSEKCRVVRVFQAGVFGRSELLVCDGPSHERHGRQQAGDITAFDIVETGLLTISRDEHRVWIAGQEVFLSRTEWRLLLCLVDRLGRLVTYDALIEQVWPNYVWSPHTQQFDKAHIVRVNVTRLRRKLSRAAGLIETRAGYGVLLRLVPVGQEAEPRPVQPFALKPDQWARKHACCVECGTTDYPHNDHGLCSRCKNRRDRDKQRAWREARKARLAGGAS